jgi:hypothetical protein
VSRGEGELLTVPKPRAVRLLSVYLAVKPVGEPDAGDRHVRFDERGWETERCRMAQATAPILDSTESCLSGMPAVWSLEWTHFGSQARRITIRAAEPSVRYLQGPEDLALAVAARWWTEASCPNRFGHASGRPLPR